MSSWMGDWERNLIPRKGGVKVKERGVCKLGRHTLLEGTPAVWLKSPMGLSCEPCVRASGVPEHLEALEAEVARLAPKRIVPAAAPAQRKAPAPRPRQKKMSPEEWVHGKRATYVYHGCRCEVCRAANAARSARYRANKAAGLQGVAG